MRLNFRIRRQAPRINRIATCAFRLTRAGRQHRPWKFDLPADNNIPLHEPVSLLRSDHATTDAGELPRLNANWSDSEYVQMDEGRFEGRLRQAIIGNTRVMEETQNRTVLKRGAIDAGRCYCKGTLDCCQSSVNGICFLQTSPRYRY